MTYRSVPFGSSGVYLSEPEAVDGFVRILTPVVALTMAMSPGEKLARGGSVLVVDPGEDVADGVAAAGVTVGATRERDGLAA